MKNATETEVWNPWLIFTGRWNAKQKQKYVNRRDIARELEEGLRNQFLKLHRRSHQFSHQSPSTGSIIHRTMMQKKMTTKISHLKYLHVHRQQLKSLFDQEKEVSIYNLDLTHYINTCTNDVNLFIFRSWWLHLQGASEANGSVRGSTQVRKNPWSVLCSETKK